MATMVKEKRREKKKTKEKTVYKSRLESDVPQMPHDISRSSCIKNALDKSENIGVTSNLSQTKDDVAQLNIGNDLVIHEDTVKKLEDNTDPIVDSASNLVSVTVSASKSTAEIEISSDTKRIETELNIDRVVEVMNKPLFEANVGATYQDLNLRLARMHIPSSTVNTTEMVNQTDTIKDTTNVEVKDTSPSAETVPTQEIEAVVPTAPVLEEEVEQIDQIKETVKLMEAKPKITCMPLEEAIRIFGGKEIAEVVSMSEREDALVEAGPISGPEHPLVDLLSTFRQSLRAVEYERIQLTQGFTDEEKFRAALWKIEKRKVDIREQCPCGSEVYFQAQYEHAELMKERLPVARLRLTRLLSDAQDSYCRQQHAALLAHCQIEELISDIIENSNKNDVREALSLVLQALRLSDNAPSAFASALQRWAAALSAALLDARDIRQLLYLLHHLFRQIRSVQWAARIIRVNVVDSVSAVQAIALLDLLLNKMRLESAVECTEETDDVWEEVDEHGSGSAVSEGTLRERDLLALLRVFPLRDIVARLVLFTNADISQARECDWGDNSCGRGVLKACCGVRTFLATLQRAVSTHPHYTTLHLTLRNLAADVLHALAGLHIQSRDYYSNELKDKLIGELQAAFAAGFTLHGSLDLHAVPTTLLTDNVSREYCIAFMLALHDSTNTKIESLSLEAPVLSCDGRVRIVTQAALDRADDCELARSVISFLLQTAVKKKPVQCKGNCDKTAQELLPNVLDVHSYLHTTAFHILADLNQAETLEPSCIKCLSADKWNPSSGEVTSVLDDWAQRCSQLIQHLLLALTYTPYRGLSLESQLSLGCWLCSWLRQPGEPPDWAWRVLRRLRVHRIFWNLHLDAPPPGDDEDLFTSSFALLSSSWGHCIPLVCSEGVSALCRLASVRPLDAVHCLSPIMMVMAHSPESVSLTPKFKELFTTLLVSGPTLVQRALGRGPVPGSELILRLMLTQLEITHCGPVSRGALLSAWLHGLWGVNSPVAGSILDTALLACREWTQYDAHAALLLQDDAGKEYIVNAVKNVAQAPLICECVLRAAHAQYEVRTNLYPRLIDVLHLQRVAGDRIHVDNALKHIGANINSEELVIYRTANAVLAAPLNHPAHLMLWRLFFHLYLQRPPSSMVLSTPPVGPLFFSGLMKSRTLGYLRKRLLETITYHHNERTKYNNTPKENTPDIAKPTQSAVEKSKSNTLFPEISIVDLTGDSSGSSESESGSEEEVLEIQVEVEDPVKLSSYHSLAEKMCRDCVRWLEEGDKVRDSPHHADVARYIPEQNLEVAWKAELLRRQPTSPSEDEYPLPSDTPPPKATPVKTPFKTVLARLLSIKDRSRRRPKRSTVKSSVEQMNLKDVSSLLNLVTKHLVDVERLASEWSCEVSRITALDSKLWDFVSALRVKRPLPSVKRSCLQKCKPITIVIPAKEWCIDVGVENAIKDNRASARAAYRRLMLPRPHAARTAATLHAIARLLTVHQLV